MNLEILKQLVSENIDSSFPLHSRVHLMQNFSFYVKREDELGFGVSGSKLRKYVSLLPVLRREKREIALLGSAYSNHVLSLVQLLKQEGIAYRLFLQKPNLELLENPRGNFFFLSLLTKKEEITWLEKTPDCLPENQDDFFWIPVGGAMKESLLGSLTLPLDLIKNEEDLGFSFDHVFVDSGSGMMALSLILGLGVFRKKTKVHVVLIGGTQESFEKELFFFQNHLETLLGEKIDPCSYKLYSPSICKSFGATSGPLFRFISEIAQNEGIFLDPIYTAKLLFTAKDLVEKENLSGKVLWIHSGGALSLTGFQEYFNKK